MYHQYKFKNQIAGEGILRQHEVKIDRKRILIISGILLALLLVISLVSINLRKTKDVVAEITLCDVDSSGLCIVTFGTDSQNNIIINFQLPDADYPVFYVKASNRGNVNTYPCQIVTAAPTSVYCIGIRTPLGEYIDIEVYTANRDTLIARGKFVVSALVRTTPINSNGTPPTPDTSTPNSLTGTPTVQATFTPVTVTAYPNPSTPYPNP